MAIYTSSHPLRTSFSQKHHLANESRSMTNHRVVITGLGAVSPYGVGAHTLWRSVVSGKIAVGELHSLSKFEISPPPLGAELCDFDFAAEFPQAATYANLTDRGMQLALVAAQEAFDDAHLTDTLGKIIPNDQFGVYLGTTTAGIASAADMATSHLTRSPRPISSLTHTFCPGAWPDLIAHHFSANGILRSASTSCYAGGESVGLSFRDIKTGRTTVALAGGCDAPIIITNYMGFRVIGATSRWTGEPAQACKPFSANRDGMVFGEGAGFLILEDLSSALERNAHIYGEVIGYAATSDGEDMVRPSHEGSRWSDAIQQALTEARISPNHIDYISCHGTGTRENDRAEVRAITDALGRTDTPIGSIKSMIGHAFGGASALELVCLSMTLREKILPPTMNYSTLDPECNMDCVPNEARTIEKCDYVLKTATGFGGSNMALVLADWSD
ncbi:beta-ketoacyl-[acyl-carrier-protein] synthase family protein [Propionibacterium australiense]|uniref:Beta-ketoacyl-[acyl-carrier-protein] synthase family protein n=2 Tax=Propionibacterium australiense TaxID=119981 RepID=A0A8B3FU61_9ACTN|nr:beta-ketoacyl-[acyl-carrier-protein] synthase family protein [Propionibacterium australiense]